MVIKIVRMILTIILKMARIMRMVIRMTNIVIMMVRVGDRLARLEKLTIRQTQPSIAWAGAEIGNDY